jgi:hypothetical protein
MVDGFKNADFAGISGALLPSQTLRICGIAARRP